MRKLVALYFVVLLGGCSQVVGEVTKIAGNDLTRTSELAAKYGKPEVKQCADFMLAQVAKLQAADAGLVALQGESTSGLFSAALKAALIAEAVRALSDANGPAFKADFKAACSGVAGDILFNIMQDAAKVRLGGLGG